MYHKYRPQIYPLKSKKFIFEKPVGRGIVHI